MGRWRRRTRRHWPTFRTCSVTPMVAAGQQNWTGSFMESNTESKTPPVKCLQTQTIAKVNKPVTKTKNLDKMKNERSTIFLYPSTDVLNVRACKNLTETKNVILLKTQK